MRIDLKPFMFLVLISSQCWGFQESFRNFWIDGKSVHLVWSPEVESWVSPPCRDGKLQPCGALRLVKLVQEMEPVFRKGELSRGMNPATQICKKLGGKLVLAKTNPRSEWFFCQADDGSMISAAALSRAR